MNSSNIRDLLTSFSPSLDFFAVSSGDGRIKIWDTVKGQVQTEFTDIVSSEPTGLLTKLERGHLSVDYTCMKWLSFDKKKKRKLGTSLLVLGTGGGDVLALNVSAGQLKWRVSDCHPGGVSAISVPTNSSCVYTAGADGIICQLDSMSGNLLGKFKASTKGISSLSVSSDGNVLATAAAQLKIFSSSDHRKLQKFSGHPGAVRCMIFSEDGKYILSSSVGERYVAVWRIDGSKKQSADCVLAMDHPAVFLDSKGIENGDGDDTGICVLAISEMGVCYFWHCMNMGHLRNSKPTVVSITIDGLLKNQKGALPNIFAAKLQGVAKPGSGHLFLAYGLVVNPSFEKVFVQYGTDIKLHCSHNGILLPESRHLHTKKASVVENQVAALDRVSAVDALLPVPKIFDLVGRTSGAKTVMGRDDDKLGVDPVTICMEDRLRSAGILNRNDDLIPGSTIASKLLKNISIENNTPHRKMSAAVLSMVPGDAYELLKVLVTMWQSRPCSAKYVLPWISCILLNHGDYILSQEPVTQLIDSLYKLAQFKGVAIQSLLQLSGRLQLILAQFDKAASNRTQTVLDDDKMNESDDGVDEFLYGVDDDDESQESSDNND